MKNMDDFCYEGKPSRATTKSTLFAVSKDEWDTKEDTECAKILLAVPNIELDVQNKLGDTALHNAAWKGHVAIVEMLLEKGCKMNLLNNEKQTPYDLAAKSPECGRLLMQHSTTADDEYGDDEDSD